jgi:hypothetical protein
MRVIYDLLKFSRPGERHHQVDANLANEVVDDRSNEKSEAASVMRKATIITELNGMAWHRLFDSPHWLADREQCSAARRRFLEMGLEEQISPNSWRSTPLGRALDVDLFMVFLGIWEPWEVPYILEKYGLIDEWENEMIWARLSRGADPDRALLDVVRRAYIDYGRSTTSIH